MEWMSKRQKDDQWFGFGTWQGLSEKEKWKMKILFSKFDKIFLSSDQYFCSPNSKSIKGSFLIKLVQWKILNMITVNAVIWLVWSTFLSSTKLVRLFTFSLPKSLFGQLLPFGKCYQFLLIPKWHITNN